MSRHFDINKRYKFVGFKFNDNDDDDDIIFDFDKKYKTYNVEKCYKYIMNQTLTFIETYDHYHYFKHSENNYEIAFIYPDEVEYTDNNQLSDKWFPVIIEN